MDANSYIYKLGMVDDEVVIKGFIIAEIVETGDKVATDTTLSFLYPAFSVEVSCPQARKGAELRAFVGPWLTDHCANCIPSFFHTGISEKGCVKQFLFSIFG